MRKDIKLLVSNLKKKFNTDNPFQIAEELHIEVQFGNIDFEGCYLFLKNHGYIFLNQNLVERELALVMAHELGHAIMHRKENCYFIKNKTFMLNSKNEKEANKFAVELLIPDVEILEHCYCTTEQLARLYGYQKELIELRLKE